MEVTSRVSRNGCVPNARTPVAVAEIQQAAVPWDAYDVPPVTTWESLKSALNELPTQIFWWWNAEGALDGWVSSQSYRPNCAGFAMSNAARALTINQIHCKHSEQKIPVINPMPCWQKSKGGSTFGGQSIAAMAQAGNEYGNYLAEDVGAYDPKVTFPTTTEAADLRAKEHQIGICLYDGRDPVEAILETCRKGLSCFVGNSVAVKGTKQDDRGVYVADLGGTWSHATAFCGWTKVDGCQYVYWINSHGNIYQTPDGTPDFGCWMSVPVLRKFMGGVFADLCIVTYAEAEHDPAIIPAMEV